MALPEFPFKAKTLVAWAAEEKGDLGFLEHEIIEVILAVDHEWWSGRLRRNNAEGIFPKQYVEVLEEQLLALRSNMLLAKSAQFSRSSGPAVEEESEDDEPHYNYSYDEAYFRKTQKKKRAGPSLKLAHLQRELEEREREIAHYKLQMRKSMSDTKRLSQQLNSLAGASPRKKLPNPSTPNKQKKRQLDQFYHTKSRLAYDLVGYPTELDDEDGDELAHRRAALEQELRELRMMESRLKRKSKRDIDYVSEDGLLRRSKENLSRKMEDYSDGYESDDPPPPPPKHKHLPVRSDNYLDEEVTRITVQQEELKNSIKSLQLDVLNLSELSATLAGLFMRHRYEKEMIAAQELRMKQLLLEDDAGASVSKQGQRSSIFKKFLGQKREENMLEKRVNEDFDMWAEQKMDLNRLNSLTSQDKQARTRRVVREELSLIVKPLDYISEINTNETIGMDDEIDPPDFSTILFRKVDQFMSQYLTRLDLNEVISDISIKFASLVVMQIRCVLIHLCKFNIIDEPTKISQHKPKLSEMMSRGEATIFQLNYIFKKTLDALRIPLEIVLGFWKKPNEFYHLEQYVINHCWLLVLMDNHLIIMDLLGFKHGLVCNIKGYNEFYFLAKPLLVVLTHIPSVIDLQHVRPPIDPNVAFHLPREYLGFHKNNLRFRNYNNALTRLRDLETVEIELELPVDVELFTLIKTSKVTTNDLSLCQIYWHNNTRIAKIKAIIPPDESIGVLQVFAGPKGLQRHFENIHELALVIPIYHEGQSKLMKFIPRYPTVQAQNNDLYVKMPQTSTVLMRSYNFEVRVHPSMGITSGSAIMNADFKMVVELPLGKYFKMTRTDSQQPWGVYLSNIKCSEVGTYRGLVIGDAGNSWYVFTQWECT